MIVCQSIDFSSRLSRKLISGSEVRNDCSDASRAIFVILFCLLSGVVLYRDLWVGKKMIWLTPISVNFWVMSSALSRRFGKAIYMTVWFFTGCTISVFMINPCNSCLEKEVRERVYLVVVSCTCIWDHSCSLRTREHWCITRSSVRHKVFPSDVYSDEIKSCMKDNDIKLHSMV